MIMVTIDANEMHYKVLNEKIRALAANGTDRIEIDNVCGQKFIGDGLKGKVKIDIKGIPGNDLAVFMDGPELTVHGNGQDNIGNTMNAGKVIIHGNAGDVIGYAMRGGEIFIKGDVGYRVGIHMKAFKENLPTIVIGGGASDFFGEYMAGGIMVVLGIDKDGQFLGDYLGSGMHGGVIYIRGEVDGNLLGRDVLKSKPGPEDAETLSKLVREYCKLFGYDYEEIMKKPFIKLTPKSHRPYGNLYAK